LFWLSYSLPFYLLFLPSLVNELFYNVELLLMNDEFTSAFNPLITPIIIFLINSINDDSMCVMM